MPELTPTRHNPDIEPIPNGPCAFVWFDQQVIINGDTPTVIIPRHHTVRRNNPKDGTSELGDGSLHQYAIIRPGEEFGLTPTLLVVTASGEDRTTEENLFEADKYREDTYNKPNTGSVRGTIIIGTPDEVVMVINQIKYNAQNDTPVTAREAITITKQDNFCREVSGSHPDGGAYYGIVAFAYNLELLEQAVLNFINRQIASVTEPGSYLEQRLQLLRFHFYKAYFDFVKQDKPGMT